ncbi:hypothetical protein J5I95_13495 [Candidatus Poribacteria bacterium]|nr:hypothetical protein [Candidatus Poribacteria bacterium]
MKKYSHLFGIILLVSLLVLVLGSCNETMTDQIDRVVDTGADPPTQEPVTPPVEEPVTPPTEEPTVPTPEPLAPLPEGTVVFVAPRPLTSPAVGQQLKVGLNIKGAAGVSGYDVTVGFDPTALRYVESANADYLPPGGFVAPAQVSANSVYLSAISLAGVANAAEGTLATITFEVVSAKASTLVLDPVVLSDVNAQELPLTAVDGQINAP